MGGGLRAQLSRIVESLRKGRLGFEWRYITGNTPWDTNVSPPELVEFILNHPPGRALDLGCGTGTNAITLTKSGWKVTGVDFSKRAIRKAVEKAKRAGLEIEFIRADVTDLSMLSGPYDLALDIGCLTGLDNKARRSYARELKRLVRAGGWYMLYAWLPRKWRGSLWGISRDEVMGLLGDCFVEVKYVVGQERGFPTAWYWFQRTPIEG